MKIALIGYGKMGKAIESIALERGHEIVAKLTSNSSLDELSSMEVDVAIEFTRPNAAVKNILACASKKIPVVVGTTAWNEDYEEVKQAIVRADSAMIAASNFSVGVNLFFALNRQLAKLMHQHNEYVPSIEEIHHLQKLDAPSGTAVTIANDLMLKNPTVTSWKLGEEHHPEVKENELGITSYRLPEVPGTHVVKYTSEIDTIEIKHEAHNRKGFAFGAVLAAEFLKGKKGIFTMQDVLNIEG